MHKYTSSTVFAKIENRSLRRKGQEAHLLDLDQADMEGGTPQPSERQIKVTSIGELSLPPDRCKVLYTVRSAKEQVQDVKNSVTRRVDYVIQTLVNHQVRESDLSVTKVLRMIDKLYHYEVEIVACFTDFEKCHGIGNLLIEKLHDSIRISVPQYHHSNQKLENLRLQTSMLALRIAKQKAIEMGQSLQASVGKVLNVCEESCDEWQGVNTGSDGPITAQQQQIDGSTIYCKVKLYATFELKHAKSKIT